ncbi:uncharacterized protein LOC132041739 [Lycium ferocissimum]|uniref:uncharacterized protein LOC132041739 n=1 Tax=Lycium ferocissimum TaxID=112874 RepID=UPI002815B4A2|nr:uncharacterized protein LOC132041739 [Lycium ferocissimum]
MSPKGVTMLMESNPEHSSTFVPKMIKWNEILSQDEWHFDAITQPKAEPESSAIEQVIQYPDGSIDLKFLRSTSANESSSGSRKSCSRPSTSQRKSFSRPSSFKPPEEVGENPEPLISEINKKLKGVDFDRTIPKVYYQSTEVNSGSPTASDMNLQQEDEEEASILTMLKSKEFKPDLKTLNEDFKSPKNKRKLEWNNRINYSTINEILIPKRKRSNNCISFQKDGYGLDNDPKTKDINKIIQQNNYTNQLLHVVSNQLAKDNNKQIAPSKASSSTSTSTSIEEHPTIRLPEFSKEKFPQLSEKFNVENEDLVEKINRQLKDIALNKPKVSTKKVTTLSTKEKEIQKLTNDPRYHTTKNYYKRPSFPDVQFEEDKYQLQTSYEGTSISSWNIDGLAESQIYKVLHEMGMAITSYRIKNASDRNAAQLIISGFTGILKNWWDNYLTEDNRAHILNAAIIRNVLKMQGETQVAVEEAIEDASKNTNLQKKKKRVDQSYKTKPRKRSPKQSAGDTCWTCGKKGHRSNDCKVNLKKKKKINLLEINDKIKHELYTILEDNDNTSSSSSEISDIEIESDDSSNSSESKIVNVQEQFVPVVRIQLELFLKNQKDFF